MANLTRAHRELFERTPDERFDSLQQLWDRCQQDKQSSNDSWHLPQILNPSAVDGRVTVTLGDDGAFLLNDWSFTQLCRLSGISKDTVNRCPRRPPVGHCRRPCRRRKANPVAHLDHTVRSLHGVVYTRLWNTDLLAVSVSSRPTSNRRKQGSTVPQGFIAANRTSLRS